MKLTYSLLLLPIAIFLAGCFEQNVTIAINPNATSTVTMEITMPRQMAEQQARMRVMQEEMGDGDEEGMTPAAPKEPKPITDAQIIDSLKEAITTDASGQFGGAEPTVESLTIKDEKVNLKASVKLDTLTEMVSMSRDLLSQIGFDTILIDTNATGQLRLTASSSARLAPYRKQQLKQMRATGMRGQIKFVMPGKIVSSTLTQTLENATWFAYDSEKPETITALGTLLESSIVIVSETGGLKLPEPLDSTKVPRRGYAPKEVQSDLPLTDAGPGFQSEATSLMATTRYQFPDPSNKQLEQFGGNANNLMIQAKIFCPKGRTILNMSGVKVKKAVDDKGRNLVLENTPENEAMGGMMQDFSSRGDQQQGVVPLTVVLKLPSADAKAIEEVSGEVTAVTAGSWKEQSITSLKADLAKTNDLSSLIPGAKLVITKASGKQRQNSYTVQVIGPPSVSQLTFKLTTPAKGNQEDGMQGNSSVTRNSSTVKNGVTVRTISLMHYGYNPQGGSVQPDALVVRMPQDLKRERVPVTFKALDLY